MTGRQNFPTTGRPDVLRPGAGGARHRPDLDPERRAEQLAEQLAHLLEEALGLRVRLLAGELGEPLEELLLLRAEVRGRLHQDAHVLVAAPSAVQTRDALALDGDHLAALGAGG